MITFTILIKQQGDNMAFTWSSPAGQASATLRAFRDAHNPHTIYDASAPKPSPSGKPSEN